MRLGGSIQMSVNVLVRIFTQKCPVMPELQKFVLILLKLQTIKSEFGFKSITVIFSKFSIIRGRLYL